MSTDKRRFDDISKAIIGCAFEVANTLGRGFVENIYANALAKELTRQTIEVRREFPVKVRYKADKFWSIFCTSKTHRQQPPDNLRKIGEICVKENKLRI